MRKFTLCTLTLLVFCIYPISLTAGDIDKKLHNECLYPTVYIGKEDKSSSGSGVIVRSERVNDNLYKNVFITCAHIVDTGNENYELREYIYDNWSQYKGFRSYSAMFVAYNRDIDIAVGVFSSNHKMPVANLNFEPDVFIGNEIFRIGCGLGDEPRLDYGKLTSYKKPKVFRTSVMTVPGDSGGPLFHENKVIGIVVSIRALRGQPIFNISHAVPLEMFKKWSKDNNNNLDFIWDNTKEIPELQFRYLKLKDYVIKK